MTLDRVRKGHAGFGSLRGSLNQEVLIYLSLSLRYQLTFKLRSRHHWIFIKYPAPHCPQTAFCHLHQARIEFGNPSAVSDADSVYTSLAPWVQSEGFTSVPQLWGDCQETPEPLEVFTCKGSM